MFTFLKKLGFTDRFGTVTSIICAIFIFTCLGIFTFTDKDPIAYMISAIGFLGTTVGFIVSKNKSENLVKLNSSCETTDAVSETVVTGFSNEVESEGEE